MAARADVGTHITARAEAIARALSGWMSAVDDADRHGAIADYLTSTDCGDVDQVGSSSVFMTKAQHDPALRTAFVIGSHDPHAVDQSDPQTDAHADTADATETPADSHLLRAPGIGSCFGSTIAFVEGFAAARQVTTDDPINLSVLSVGPGDRPEQLIADLAPHSADAIFLTNSVAWDPNHPTITVGCRGRLVVELALGGTRPIADAMTAGAVRNPLNKLVEILASLRDDRGRVAIPGFYDRAQRPDVALRDGFIADDHDPNAWAELAKVARPSGRLSALERATMWPAISMLSIEESRSGALSTPDSASALLAIYLVADQQHAEIERSLRAWFIDQAPVGLVPSIRLVSSARPYRATRDATPVAAQARTALRLRGRQPILVPAGGSFGAGEIADQTGTPVGFAGICGPEHGFGTALESIPRHVLDDGIATAADTCLSLRRANVRPVT